MQDILFSGNATFNIEVPYKLIESGESEEKPLIIYLHGFNQNIEQFQELVSGLSSLEAYHLFIQGPYPIYDRKREKKVEDWGRSWYLYDGEQKQFVKSLDLGSEFVAQVTNNMLKHITVSRISLFGYSMGGYLAGYFALSRPQFIDDLIVIGGRIKTEVFEERRQDYNHLNVLALHGRQDTSVESSPQEKSCQQLSQWGANVTFKVLDASHALSGSFLHETKQWLQSNGYD
jgi:predicted esterase